MKTSAAQDSPFVGLAYYTEQDAEFFFGRSAERTRIIGNLYASRLTLLYAQSGVGKSSLLRAGVSARLRVLADENYAQEGSPHYLPVVFNAWTDDPVGGLIDAITEAAEPFRNGAVDGLSVPRGSLAEAINRIATESDSTLLIILDQFEEYFLYRSHETGEKSIAEQLARCISRPDVAANFLIAIREDAYARLGDLFKSRITNVYDNYLHLEYLDRQGGREAIAKPVELYNLRHPGEEPVGVEPELVEAVLDQVAPGKILIGDLGLGTVAGRTAANVAQSVETPYLQLVMERLWREELASGSRKLRLTTLASMGGAKRIVQEHLDAALAGMPADQQEIAAAAFRYLVTPSGTKLQLSASDLAQLVDVPTVELETVLARLSASDARILREMTSPEANSPRYEIFHDVLAAPILEWHKQHEQVKERAELAAELEAERARREKELRDKIFRWAAVVLLALVAGLVVLATLAVKGEDSARSARSVAESRQLAAEATSQLEVDPAVSAQLAAQAVRKKPTDEAQDALRASLDEIRGVLRVRGDTKPKLRAADFSADGTRVVTAGEDGKARIWNAASDRILEVLSGHRGEVFAAAFSPDGTRVVTAGEDGTARIWSSSNGRQLKLLRGHRGTVYAAAFNPHGPQVVTAGEDGTTRIWDSSSGRLIKILRAPTPRGSVPASVNAAAFSFDGSQVVTGGDDGKARIWDSSNGRLLKTLAGHALSVVAASFSGDGMRVVTASADETARVWDVATDRSIELSDGTSCLDTSGTGTPQGPESQSSPCSPVWAARFSPDGSQVVTGGDDTTVRIWDASSGQSLDVLRGDKGAVRAAAFSPDGTAIVSASEDGTARIWRTPSEQGLAVLRPHKNTVLAAAFRPTGTRVLTVEADGTARLWDSSSGRLIKILRPPRHPANVSVNAAAFSPDGKRVVTASADGTARIRDAASGRSIAVLRGHTHEVLSAAFSADGQRVVTASADETAGVWDASSGDRIAVLRGHTGRVYAAAFSPDGERVVTASDDSTARLWDASSGDSLAVLRGHTGPVSAAAFSPDGERVVTASGDGTARIWDASNGKRLFVLPSHTGFAVVAATFSPDGRRVLTASADGTARTWDASTGKGLAVLSGHTGSVLNASFNADGHLVLTADADGTARIWLASSGQSLEVLRGHVGSVLTASFSPDGRRVVTAGLDQTARIYACEICGPLNDLLGLAARVSS